MEYWRGRRRAEGTLRNDHYKHFFTTHFGYEDGFYDGKRMLDIGCGPRGSLEWATGAARRVGLDPLADSYRDLGIEDHAMEYVAAPAEAMPFDEGYFDVVTSFNSLDHVEDLDAVIREIGRVTALGGNFLLLTEVNHPPTATEPITLSWDVLDRFARDFRLLEQRRFELHPKGIYDAIWEDRRYDELDPTVRPAYLSAQFRRT